MRKNIISNGADIAKAIGIFFVVLGHVIRGLFNANIIPIDNKFWSMVDQSIYLFHMPLFFFIAGIFFKDSVLKKGFWGITKRNILVLLVPMIAWSYLQFGLQYLAASSANSIVTFNDFLYAPLPPKAQFWFLWALFKITLVVGLILIVNKRSQAILVFLSISALALTFTPTIFVVSILGMDVIKHLPYFVLGVIGVGNLVESIKAKTWLLLLLFLITISISLIVNIPNEAIKFIFSTILVLIVFKISLNFSVPYQDKTRGCMQTHAIFIGMNSMIIYLAHVIFQASYRALLLHFKVDAITPHIIGGVLSGLLFPILLIYPSLFIARYHPKITFLILPVRTTR